MAGGGGIFKSAAVEVLRRERRLMTTGEITKYVSGSALIATKHGCALSTLGSKPVVCDVDMNNGLHVLRADWLSRWS